MKQSIALLGGVVGGGPRFVFGERRSAPSSKSLRFKKRKEEERGLRQKAQRGVALSADDTLHLLKIRLLLRYFFPRSPFSTPSPPLPPPPRVPSSALFPLFVHSSRSSLPPSLAFALKAISSTTGTPRAGGERGWSKTSPKFLFPDSIPFHLTSRKLLFDSSLCRRWPRCSPMHMTVSKKTHCERPGYNLLRAYSPPCVPLLSYRAAITRQAFRCLSSSSSFFLARLRPTRHSGGLCSPSGRLRTG